MIDPGSAKAALREEMRVARRSVSDAALRSERIWALVEAIPAVRSARTILVFDSIPGEPDTAPLIRRRRASGQCVVVPEDLPGPDPATVDVVIVPGVAFTAAGDRLGQGGGWYDRFLARVPPSCLAIGVGFEVQLCDRLPTEGHDVMLDAVATEAAVYWSSGAV